MSGPVESVDPVDPAEPAGSSAPDQERSADYGTGPGSGTDAFVEEAGLYFERLGLSRTSGRVMGVLLTRSDADAPELAGRLGVAKSSLSVALRQLEGAGLLLRFRSPGHRRDRYRLAEDVFARGFRARMAEFEAFTALATRGLAVVGDDPGLRLRLELMRDMYAFMAVEFPRLLDRWDAQARERTGGA
ncbi:MAG: MarR family transcriptional regulator [Kineosporiaceae bacterium]